jgi:hypothetical protein
MKQFSKLTPRQEQEQAAELHSARQAGLDFDSVEALLRHDAARTPVPGQIAERLRQSVEEVETPRLPWWRRLLG